MEEESSINWSRPKQNQSDKGPHPDYAHNLHVGLNFMDKVRNVLPPGMRTYICSSHGLKDSMFMVSFDPPKEWPAGRYATPLFLHQDKQTFERKIANVFNSYLDMIKKFEIKFNDGQR